MPRSAVFASALVGALLTPWGAPAIDAQVSRGDSAMFVAITQQLLDAITDGDSGVWARHLSPRWTMTDEEGHRIGRTDFLRDLHPLPSGQSGKLRLADWLLVGTPTVTVMSYAADEEHVYYGQRLVTRFRQTDTWVREGKAWHMLASQVTALPTPIEGRAIPRRVLDAYAGEFALTPDITLTITVADSGLYLVRPSRPAERLYAIDERIFVRHGVRGFWLFERDSAGAVSRLVNWRDNNPVIWRRRASGSASDRSATKGS
jgi:hypothetical protein